MPNASIVTQDSANPAYIYAVVFVDELQRAGIGNVVICPGSRSTHLAMAFVAQTAIRTWMHVDERSAAFFGLGWQNSCVNQSPCYAHQEQQQQTFYLHL